MHDLALAVPGLGLVDLLVGLAVVGAVIGALRRRSGTLGAVGSGLGTLLAAWLVVVSVATWGPAGAASAAERSRLLHTVPAPDQAIAEAGRLLTSRS